jgi:predicted  nucleic acid-binding Zn-ribbon protein
MAVAASNRNLARELMGLATEIDSLAKSLARTQEELAREHSRRQHFEQETVDLSAALAQARQRATVAERDLGRLVSELDTGTQTAQVREHELQTRLNEADQTIERLRREVDGKERQRLALETDLSDVMQNLRHAASEAAWPSLAHSEPQDDLVDSDAEATRVGW